MLFRSKDYPAISWSIAGMQPLRFALIGCVVVTAIGGILSTPLFDWATATVAGTPILQQALAATASLPLA